MKQYPTTTGHGPAWTTGQLREARTNLARARSPGSRAFHARMVSFYESELARLGVSDTTTGTAGKDN